MKKLMILMAAALIFIGCQKKNDETASQSMDELKDGTYHGVSTDDEWGGRVEADITIKDGKIVEAELHNIDKSGNEKGEDYGKDAGNQGLFKIAQAAIKNAQEYPKKLVETNDVDKIDAISGATTSLEYFKEAVKDALSKAK